MKTLMCCLALVGMVVFTPPAFAGEPTLASVEVKFDTTTNSKKQDANVDIYLKDRGDQDVAKSEGNEGLWEKHSTHTLALQIAGSPTKAEVVHGRVILAFHPNGGDTWKFNYQATLKFSDGSSITKEVFGCVLTQYNTARKDPL